MKKYLLFFITTLTSALQINAQQLSASIKVNGQVIDEIDHTALSGATLALINSGTDFVTSDDGRFTVALNVPVDTLLISHIGYLDRKIVLKSDIMVPLIISLRKSVTGLNEVVVSTGYQDIPKERATGSFVQIDNKTLNQQVGGNILDRINGVASGTLFPIGKNDAPKVMIRGLSTINGPKDPLIVVDNFPYEGDLNNINPNDIESVTILKDAAAASIWGTRSGNGVIVINTKKGGYNQSLQIELNSDLIVVQKPDLFILPQISSSDYIDVEQMLFNRGFYNNEISSKAYPALSPAVEIFLKSRNGEISSGDSAAYINRLKGLDVRNDYSRFFYQSQITQQYALNLRGGGDKMAYFISGGYDKNIGHLGNRYNKLNIHLENSYKPVNNLQLRLGMFYTNSHDKSGKPSFNSIDITGRSVPYLSFTDEFGNPLSVPVALRDAYTDTAGKGRLLDWKYYPLNDYKHNTTTLNLQDLMANLRLKYRIDNELYVEFSYQYEKQQSDSRNLQDLQSYAARNLINTFSQINSSTGVVKYIVPLGGILNDTRSISESHNFRAQINYSKLWNNQSINAIVGGEVRQSAVLLKSDGIYGYNDDLLTTSNVDYVNPYPSFVNGNNTFIPSNISLSEKLNRFVDLFANASYAFKGKYIVSASFRKDASNLFGVSTNDKWNPFWSSGIAWSVSDESFYKFSLFPYMKLRMTYGFTGNVDQSKSAVPVIGYFSGNNSYTNLPQAKISQFANPELRWERVGILNIGIDFSVKNQVASGSIEYYHKRGTDLFGRSPIDYTVGLNTAVVVKNVANMTGEGVDLVLRTRNINQDFKWNTNFLLNYAVSKTRKYYFPPGSSFGANSGYSISPLLDKPLYSILSYRWADLDKFGNPQGYLKGLPSTDYNEIFRSLTDPDSLVFSGSAVPELFGSLINEFSWKGFSLALNISYALDYYFRKPSISYSQLFNSGIGHPDFSKRWQNRGDEMITNVPSMVYPVNPQRDVFYLGSDINVGKADNIRLRYVNLSYDFSNIKQVKYPFHLLQLYINISNMGILWRANKDGIDPDYPSSIPSSRSYAIGIRMKF